MAGWPDFCHGSKLFRSGLGLLSAAHIFHIPINQHVTFSPFNHLPYSSPPGQLTSPNHLIHQYPIFLHTPPSQFPLVSTFQASQNTNTTSDGDHVWSDPCNTLRGMGIIDFTAPFGLVPGCTTTSMPSVPN